MGLQRFVDAQEINYIDALQEIKQGKKRTHWMWYVFPKLQNLGRSNTAKFYGLANINEAVDYLNDAVLGPRLITISKALLDLPGTDAYEIFGSPDDMKLCSCMTLFALILDTNAVFQSVIDKFYGGRRDPETEKLVLNNRV